MAIKVKQVVKQDNTYNNLDFSDIEGGDSFEITLSFDEPLERDGLYGKYYLFNGTLHQEGQDIERVSFIARGRSSIFGKKMHDDLMQYKAGDRLKLSLQLKKGKKGFFEVWTVEKQGADNSSQSMSDEDYQDIIESLRKETPGTLTEQSIRTMMNNLGFTDETDIQRVIKGSL